MTRKESEQRMTDVVVDISFGRKLTKKINRTVFNSVFSRLNSMLLCYVSFAPIRIFFMLLYFAGQCDQLIVVDAVFRFCILCYIHTHLHNLAYRSELLLHGKDCEYFQSFFQLISIHLRPVCGLAHHHHTHGC